MASQIPTDPTETLRRLQLVRDVETYGAVALPATKETIMLLFTRLSFEEFCARHKLTYRYILVDKNIYRFERLIQFLPE